MIMLNAVQNRSFECKLTHFSCVWRYHKMSRDWLGTMISVRTVVARHMGIGRYYTRIVFAVWINELKMFRMNYEMSWWSQWRDHVRLAGTAEDAVTSTCWKLLLNEQKRKSLAVSALAINSRVLRTHHSYNFGCLRNAIVTDWNRLRLRHTWTPLVVVVVWRSRICYFIW